jgi:ubiquinone/menaquinone biosynthesis C-methylase UbiE
MDQEQVKADEAVEFIRPAVDSVGGVWADLGAGRGTFTRALATILGDTGKILAVDRDPDALDALARLARRLRPAGRISVAAGDLSNPNQIPALTQLRLDGLLLANTLHYFDDAARILAGLTKYAKPAGRIVIVEYERTTPNRWVPHPLPISRLRSVADAAGLTAPRILTRRPSAFQGEMYCALAFNRPQQ